MISKSGFKVNLSCGAGKMFFIGQASMHNLDTRIALCCTGLSYYFALEGAKEITAIISDKPFNECYRLILNDYDHILIGTKSGLESAIMPYDTLKLIRKLFVAFNTYVLYAGVEI